MSPNRASTTAKSKIIFAGNRGTPLIPLDQKTINEYMTLQILVKGFRDLICQAARDGNDDLVLTYSQKRAVLFERLQRLKVEVTLNYLLKGE